MNDGASSVSAGHLKGPGPAHPLGPKTERWVQEIELGEEA